MAVARVSSGRINATSGSVDCTGATLLVCAINSSDTISSVTYNGVALTQIGSSIPNGGNGIKGNVWALVNPATGSNTLSCTSSPAGDANFQWITYSGTKLTFAAAIPENSAQASASGAIVTSLTTTIDNSWTVLFAMITTGNNSVDFTAGTGSTLVSSNNAQVYFTSYDSNAAVTPAGSNSMTVTPTNNGATIMFSVAPSQFVSLTAAQGSFSLSGFTASFSRGYTMIIAAGSFVFTGFSATFTAFLRWVNGTKNTTSVSNGTKNTTSWTNGTKDSTTFTNQNKS